MNRDRLSTLLFYKKLIRIITSRLMRQDTNYLLSYLFLEYLYYRLKKLCKQNLDWNVLPDKIIRGTVNDLKYTEKEYVDYDSCLLINIELFKQLSPLCYVCSMISLKRYKLKVVPINFGKENTILISETMQYNLQNALHCDELDKSCFFLSSENDVVQFASEASISLIANPYNCTFDIMDTMLQNYFLYPRYLHVNDVFGVDKEYAPNWFYSSDSSTIPMIYFKVNHLKVDCNKKCVNHSVNSCYVVYGVSTLIQGAKVHSYIPRQYFHLFDNETILLMRRDKVKRLSRERYPLALLIESFEYLRSCITPFTKKDVRWLVRPIFLLKGPRGSGKRELIRTVAKSMGLHLLAADFAEVQSLIPAHTETKLRTLLQNAQRCVPCILYLNNIQIFGKTSEGQKDERVISVFATEIAALYNTEREFPLIIVAASDETDIPAELQRMFVETIHVKHLNQDKRTLLLSSIMFNNNLKTRADLSKVAGLCSDFRFADLLTLSLLAAKLRYKLKSHYDSLSIIQEDFNQIYEYMQSICSDSKGVPRVPKVHWEDIGGLAELKQEIIRRIQLPLLNAFGFGQSGLLLYGPPGTGKTLLAKAVATEYQLHFLSIKGPEVLNMYVGQSEKNVREIFERARSAAPCIIFFDELDSLAPNRGRSGDSGGVMDRVVSQLLAEMDGLEGSSSIFIIGATNRPDLIDPALLRPGRFDKLLYVGIHSDRVSKLNVLKAQTRKFKLQDNGRELELFVDFLPQNVTGADLYSVSSNAWLNAVRKVVTKYEQMEKVNKNTPTEEQNKQYDKVDNDIIVEWHNFMKANRDLIPSVSDEEIKRYNRIQTKLASS